MGRKQDLTGKRFSRLVVITEKSERNNQGSIVWECLCDCGATTTATAKVLNSLAKRSCGCFQRDLLAERNFKHNLSGTPAWNSWKSMLSRCSNPNQTGCEYYGGRGIAVCDSWNPEKGGSFENFYKDMGERPEGMTLDRVDVDGNYCKENCRWADWSTQMLNRREY